MTARIFDRFSGHRSLHERLQMRGTGADVEASAARRSRACTRLNSVGTKKSVAQVAKQRPPITARPSGRFCPASSAIGHMPMIIASAVISTGRKRVLPASSAAVTASAPSSNRVRPKLMTRIELAVATPMHMIAPVERRNRQGRPGREQHPDDAGERGWQRHDDHERIEPGLEVDDDQEVDQDHRHREADDELRIRARHHRHLAAQHDAGALRHVMRRVPHHVPDIRRHSAEVASLRRRVDVDDRADVVMVDDGVAGLRVTVERPPSNCAVEPAPAVTGISRSAFIVSKSCCGVCTETA